VTKIKYEHPFGMPAQVTKKQVPHKGNSLLGKSVNLRNTDSVLKEKREILLQEDQSGLDSKYSQLESTWKHISSEPEYERYWLTTADNHPVDDLLSMINSGVYPPPEHLLVLAECFNHYFSKKGETDLEDVFFGRPIESAGNYARRSSETSLFREFHNKLVLESKKKNKRVGNRVRKSREKIAEAILLREKRKQTSSKPETVSQDDEVTYSEIEAFLKRYNSYIGKQQVSS